MPGDGGREMGVKSRLHLTDFQSMDAISLYALITITTWTAFVREKSASVKGNATCTNELGSSASEIITEIAQSTARRIHLHKMARR